MDFFTFMRLDSHDNHGPYLPTVIEVAYFLVNYSPAFNGFGTEFIFLRSISQHVSNVVSFNVLKYELVFDSSECILGEISSLHVDL